MISHDSYPLKEQVQEESRERFRTCKFASFRILQYEEYKELICDAKWSLTFGEGLDAYFVEPTFSGANAFAVFNELFYSGPRDSTNGLSVLG